MPTLPPSPSSPTDNPEERMKKLKREIWLFEQWLNAIQEERSETAARIRAAYQDCIQSRRERLNKLSANF